MSIGITLACGEATDVTSQVSREERPPSSDADPPPGPVQPQGEQDSREPVATEDSREPVATEDSVSTTPLPDEETSVVPTSPVNGPTFRCPNVWDLAGNAVEVAPWESDSIEQLASGMLWGLAMDATHVYVAEATRNNGVPPPAARVLRIDKATLDSVVVASEADGLVDPSTLLLDGNDLYIGDGYERGLFRIPKDGGMLVRLFEGVVGPRELVKLDGVMYAAGYGEGGIFEVDPAASAAVELYAASYPWTIGAVAGRLAWGTNGHNAWEVNELVLGEADGSNATVLLETAGIVSGFAAKDSTLYWVDYALPMSALGALDVAAEAGTALEAGSHDRYRFEAQPLALSLVGDRLYFGVAPGLFTTGVEGGAIFCLPEAEYTLRHGGRDTRLLLELEGVVSRRAPGRASALMRRVA